MSNDATATATTAEPTPKKGMVIKLVIGITLLGAGAGGVYGALQAGLISTPGSTEQDNAPKLVRKGDTDPYAPPAKNDDIAMVHGDGGSKYATQYHIFEGSFTSNLKDSDALVQLALAASTRRDGRVLMWLKNHELAIRSAILVELTNTQEDDVITPEGKQRLERRLTDAVNKVLSAHEGFGGVDAVHFQSFIVQ